MARPPLGWEEASLIGWFLSRPIDLGKGFRNDRRRMRQERPRAKGHRKEVGVLNTHESQSTRHEMGLGGGGIGAQKDASSDSY